MDVLTERLMTEFNGGNGPPVVCATFQAYLKRWVSSHGSGSDDGRHPEFVKTQLARAKKGNYKLIFKQVRGEYFSGAKNYNSNLPCR